MIGIGERLYKQNINWESYRALANWCNSNNATIDDKGTFYEVVALPEQPQPTVQDRYQALVVQYIRERYTADDETALLRKRLAGLDVNEFQEYNDFCEQCKARARQELGL